MRHGNRYCNVLIKNLQNTYYKTVTNQSLNRNILQYTSSMFHYLIKILQSTILCNKNRKTSINHYFLVQLMRSTPSILWTVLKPSVSNYSTSCITCRIQDTSSGIIVFYCCMGLKSDC